MYPSAGKPWPKPIEPEQNSNTEQAIACTLLDVCFKLDGQDDLNIGIWTGQVMGKPHTELHVSCSDPMKNVLKDVQHLVERLELEGVQVDTFDFLSVSIRGPSDYRKMINAAANLISEMTRDHFNRPAFTLGPKRPPFDLRMV